MREGQPRETPAPIEASEEGKARAARALERRLRRAKIAKLSFDGMTAAQIAQALGMTKGAVLQMAKRHGIPLSRPGATTRVVAWTSRQRFQKFLVLAESQGLSAGAYLDRMIKVATDDPEGHRRYMGRDGMPKRRYGGMK